MRGRRLVVVLAALAPAVALAALLTPQAPRPAESTSGNSITTATDCPPNCGNYGISLALDAGFRPAVSFTTSQSYGAYVRLHLLRCNDGNCANGDESVTLPDPDWYTGRYSSLALDASGNPVVSYYYLEVGDLRVIHCNDPNCAGGNESITTPDTGGGRRRGWPAYLARP